MLNEIFYDGSVDLTDKRVKRNKQKKIASISMMSFDGKLSCAHDVDNICKFVCDSTEKQ